MGDYSGRTNTGTCTNCPTLTAQGKVNGAYSFNHSNNQIITLTQPTEVRTGPFTVSIWAKVNTVQPRNSFFTLASSKWAQIIHDWTTPDYTHYLASPYYDVYTSTNISTSEWVHIVNVYSDPGIETYINGVKDTALTCPSNNCPGWDIAVPETSMYIGYVSTEQRYFNGLIDEVTIWNRALSASEISALYSSNTGLSLIQ